MAFVNKTILIIVAVGLTANACQNRERLVSHYSAWEAILADGAVERGWLPSFLPSSSTNISEMHDLDSNAGVFRFFASSSDMKSFVAYFEHVPTARLRSIGPWLEPRSSWWPPALAKRQLHDAKRQGFEIYQHTESTGKANLGIWYFAISVTNGVGYGWHKGQ